MRKLFFKVREYISLFSLIVFLLTVVSIVLYRIVVSNVAFADFFNYNLSAPVRLFMAKLTVVLPFSLAEIFVFSSPLLLAILIFLAIKNGRKGKKSSIKFLFVLLAIICLLFVLFVWTYSSGYHTSPIEDKMNLDRGSLSKEELYASSQIIANELNELCKDVNYDESGASTHPYSYDEMSQLICTGYSNFANKYGVLRTFSSRIKPLLVSEPLTYTHLSGIYTFMTGEANINSNYPDFIIASSSAHELAHQRGIAREDEANFIAFAVLLETNDSFLKYCAYLDVYSNVLNDLYSADKDLYFDVVSKVDERVLNDLRSYSRFFEKYANSKASEVVDSVNDSYLQANGQENGTKSYGMITELVCAYLLNKQK